jgi:hypothetical protein
VAVENPSDRQGLITLLEILMMSDQAQSRRIRSRNQGLIREGGDRDREAVSNC